MSNYRRRYVPGGSYFFTVVTERRAKILGNDLARDLLRAAFQDCFQHWPTFRVDAMVMLHDFSDINLTPQVIKRLAQPGRLSWPFSTFNCIGNFDSRNGLFGGMF